ncbi:Transposase [Geitlerinema sp. FC II]|nr:Transposase [Geitlerinema sp. FC II]
MASGQVICSRGQRQIENACGVEATGDRVTDSSWLAVKQEIFGATQGISLHTRNGLLGEDVNSQTTPTPSIKSTGFSPGGFV